MTEDISSEAAEAIHHTFRAWVDQKHAETGMPREQLCVLVGKAMVMEGCTFIGNALGITDADVGLTPARECLERFKELAGEDGQ